MPTPEDAKRRAAFAYNAASDVYDDSALGFRDYFGRKTVEKLNLGEGARVLDVCCGSGASAIPAAELVGPSGCVLGIDLADRLLTLAREKARQRALQNITFRVGDMLELHDQPASFDVVLCVFGIFFVPNMSEAVRELWRFVRPGGELAITTVGPNFLEPANSAFWRTILELRPELHKAFNPWDRINDPETLRQMLREGGVEAGAVIAENRWHPIHSPEDWWTIVLGSGYRGTVEKLTPTEVTTVKEANVAFVRDHGITRLETNALYAVAPKKIDLIRASAVPPRQVRMSHPGS